jgi:hypothetical protein
MGQERVEPWKIDNHESLAKTDILEMGRVQDQAT